MGEGYRDDTKVVMRYAKSAKSESIDELLGKTKYQEEVFLKDKQVDGYVYLCLLDGWRTKDDGVEIEEG